MNKILNVNNMKSVIFLIISFLISLNLSYGQDKITTKQGRVIDCEILSIDSIKIVFSFKSADRQVNTFIDLNKISSYKHNGIEYFIKDNGSISSSASSIQELRLINKTKADSIENKYSNFVYTFNNDIITGKIVDYREYVFGKKHLLVDSVPVYFDEVKFYKTNEGLYANTRNLSSTHKSVFAERIEKGKINVYSQLVPTGGGIYGGQATAYYYNRDFEYLREVTYSNLLIDLRDNNEAMKTLKRYKSNNIILIGGVAGAAILGAGLISWANRDPNWGGNPPPALIVGGLVISGSIVIHFATKAGTLRKSIRIYNTTQ
jgi:hypothetical protein